VSEKQYLKRERIYGVENESFYVYVLYPSRSAARERISWLAMGRTVRAVIKLWKDKQRKEAADRFRREAAR
jgi:hypothetical protein